MNKLPQELLPLIIEHVETQSDLHTCAFINKSFLRATLPVLWRAPKFINVESAEQFITALASSSFSSFIHPRVGTMIRTLAIPGSLWSDKVFHVFITNHVCHLETVSIHFAHYITNRMFGVFFFRCCSHHLTSLFLRGVGITQASMDALGQYCLHLNSLALIDCLELGPDTLSALSACPLKRIHLESINFSMQMTDTSMMPLIGFVGLTDLTLWNFGIWTSMHRVFSTATAAAAAEGVCWPNLVRLSIKGYKDNGHVLVPFLQSLVRLQHLCLNQCTLSSTTAILDAVPALPNLKTLDVSGSSSISAQWIRQLTRDSPMLDQVKLSHCDITSDMFPEATRVIQHRRRFWRVTDRQYLQQSSPDTITRLYFRGASVEYD